jgi:hypothetical protein
MDTLVGEKKNPRSGLTVTARGGSAAGVWTFTNPKHGTMLARAMLPSLGKLRRGVPSI